MVYVFVTTFEPGLGRDAFACEAAIMKTELELWMQLYFALSGLLLL